MALNPSPPISRRALAAMVALGCLSLFAERADAVAWTVVKHNGRDYVTAQNIKDFYRFDSWGTSAGTVYFKSPRIEMRIRNGSDNLYINRVLFRLSFPVVQKGKDYLFSRIDLAKLIDPVLRPSYIHTAKRFKTIIIDAGHGGADPGSKGAYGSEKIFTLRLANLLKRDLERRGFRVRMTRSGDTYPTLGQRVVFANRVPDSIFISLHFNWFKDRSAAGLETYALSPQGSGTHNDRGPDGRSLMGNSRDSENIALATAIHAAVLKKTRAEDRGIKRDRFTVLAGINKPAILVEGGFLSNSAEAKRIASTSYLSLIASGIADACVTYRNALRK